MTTGSGSNEPKTSKGNGWLSLPVWMGIVIAGLLVVLVLLLGLLAVSIMERRWEAQRPAMVVRPIARGSPTTRSGGRTTLANTSRT